eukprot:2479729-Rhodomonas_salina.1
MVRRCWRAWLGTLRGSRQRWRAGALQCPAGAPIRARAVRRRRNHPSPGRSSLQADRRALPRLEGAERCS